VPSIVDFDHFDPAGVSPDRVDRARHTWGVKSDTKVIVVTGRMVRRKGHDVVVRAVQRLKDAGLKDFVCVFAGEEQRKTRYGGELWDLVLATNTADVIRRAGPGEDRAASYAAATLVVSAAIQAEGLQRAILEALAMARPVVTSDLAAGPDVVQAPPLVAEERMTGLRVPAGDDAALAAALIRLLSLPEAARRAMGMRGREWVISHFDPATVVQQTLAIYAEVARSRK
jgi:glycosyltransferase involved in cell wall biosynthesis